MPKSILPKLTFKMHTSSLRYVALGLLAVAIVIVAPVSSYAQSGSIGGRPANPDPSNTRTQSIFVKTIQPGVTIEDAVEVVNNTGVKKSVMVYATDSIVSSGGAFACAQAADKQKSVGQWIELSQSTIDIEANGTTKVPFSITPPANAEPGEQNGCIIIQEQKESNFQSGVSLSFRTAIRVAILIPGDIKKEITLNGLNIDEKTNKIIVIPSVKNTGNVSVDADITTTIKSVFSTVQSTQTSTYPVLRGEASEWNFEMNKPFWGGLYTASFTVAYDTSNNFLGENKDVSIKTVEGQSRLIFVTPSIVAFLIEFIIFVGLITGAYYLYRFLMHKKNVKTWVDYKVKSADTIESIALKRNISWKVLARENKIHAPYILQTQQTIKVPGKLDAKNLSTPKK
jgi:hypothetical protein